MLFASCVFMSMFPSCALVFPPKGSWERNMEPSPLYPTPITTMTATLTPGIFRTFAGNTNTTTHDGSTNTTIHGGTRTRTPQTTRARSKAKIGLYRWRWGKGGRRGNSMHVALVERNLRPKKQRKTITFKENAVAAQMARELGG